MHLHSSSKAIPFEAFLVENHFVESGWFYAWMYEQMGLSAELTSSQQNVDGEERRTESEEKR